VIAIDFGAVQRLSRALENLVKANINHGKYYRLTYVNVNDFSINGTFLFVLLFENSGVRLFGAAIWKRKL
jgi:hypothetical protein